MITFFSKSSLCSDGLDSAFTVLSGSTVHRSLGPIPAPSTEWLGFKWMFLIRFFLLSRGSEKKIESFNH